MVMQGLPPSMKHGDEPELGAGMLWIGGNDAQCLSHCSEEDGVDGRLILERDLGHRRRHGEDDVEIGDRQQLGLPICQPLGAGLPLTLRAMAVAAGNGRRPLLTLWADSVMGSRRGAFGVFQ